MKKFLIIFFSIILTNTVQIPAFAAETDDWATLMNDYEKNSSFEKIISNTEYQKAIETRQGHKKKLKKDKKSKKNQPPPMMENNIPAPVLATPLLVLPVDTYYENRVVKRGFYQINYLHKSDKYFIELKQGNEQPIQIEAKLEQIPGKVSLKKDVTVEKINDKMVKIVYTENDFRLESVLWIYY